MLRKITAILLFPVLALVTACAQIPSESPVISGPDLDPQNVTEPIYYSPSGPYDGQTQQQVMTGFITAGTGPQNDYLTARDFLSKDFRATWSPNDEVLVLTGGIQVDISAENIAIVTVKVQARVDEAGILYNFPEPIVRQLNYQLVQESGQWRIATGPNLTILNKAVFDVLFSGYSLYFFDISRQYLVPELRWFPARASTATRLTNALITGASTWLQPAVLRPLPKDVGLAIQAVTIQGGTAIISLNDKANALSDEDLRYFKTQAQVTLRQLPAVSDVSIHLDSIPRLLSNVGYSESDSTGTTPVVLTNSRLEFLTGNPVQGSQALIKQNQANDFALNTQTREVVMLSVTGLQWAKLGQIDRSLVLLDSRFALLSPSFDRSGKIWSISQQPSGEVRMVSKNFSQKVRADWLSGFSIEAYSVSREGSRMAVVVKRGQESKIFVSAIVRGTDGIPTELGSPIEFQPVSGSPVNVAWSSENQITVAYRIVSRDQISVYQATLGGTTNSFGSVSSVKQIFSDSAGKAIYVLTKNLELWENRGYGFNLIGAGISAAHLPK